MFVLCVFFSGCGGNYQKEIDEIYVRHSSFGMTEVEYRIDLKNAKVWKYAPENRYEMQQRDETAENDGYTFMRDLEEKAIEVFARESARFSFTKWEEFYIDEGVMDGHQWKITINFADGTAKEIYGSNKYPKTWDKMGGTFEELTGENVLGEKIY